MLLPTTLPIEIPALLLIINVWTLWLIYMIYDKNKIEKQKVVAVKTNKGEFKCDSVIVTQDTRVAIDNLFEEKIETAKNLLKYGDPIEKISMITGLTLEKVQQLHAEIKE